MKAWPSAEDGNAVRVKLRSGYIISRRTSTDKNLRTKTWRVRRAVEALVPAQTGPEAVR